MVLLRRGWEDIRRTVARWGKKSEGVHMVFCSLRLHDLACFLRFSIKHLTALFLFNKKKGRRYKSCGVGAVRAHTFLYGSQSVCMWHVEGAITHFFIVGSSQFPVLFGAFVKLLTSFERLYPNQGTTLTTTARTLRSGRSRPVSLTSHHLRQYSACK